MDMCKDCFVRNPNLNLVQHEANWIAFTEMHQTIIVQILYSVECPDSNVLVEHRPRLPHYLSTDCFIYFADVLPL